MTKEEKVKFIEDRAGLSAGLIATHLQNASRNAIIGFCHRYKIPLGTSANVKAGKINLSDVKQAAPRPPVRRYPTKPVNKAKKPETLEESIPEIQEAISQEVEASAPEELADIFEEPAISYDRPVSIINLTARTCRWPVSLSYKGMDPEDMMFCGRFAVDHYKYCEHHSRVNAGSRARAIPDADEEKYVQKKPSVRLWRA